MMITESIRPSSYIFSRLPGNIEIELPTTYVKLSGEYTINVYRSDGSLRYTTTFQNEITDSGIERFTSASSSRWMDRAIFLRYFFPEAQTTDVLFMNNTVGFEAPYFARKQVQFRFPVGSLNGEIHQVAVGWGIFSYFSLTDIKDTNGDPVRLKILPSEYVDLFYTLRMFIPTEEFNFSIILEGVQHDGVIRTQRINDPTAITSGGVNVGWNLAGQNSGTTIGNAPLRTATGTGSGEYCSIPLLWDDDQLSNLLGNVRQVGSFANNSPSTISTVSDSPNSIQTTVFWNLDRGNTANGIGRMCYRTGNTGRPTTNWNAIFEPRIMKDADRQLTLIFGIAVRK